MRSACQTRTRPISSYGRDHPPPFYETCMSAERPRVESGMFTPTLFASLVR